MLSFSPTRALRRVDFPTFGRPTSAANPQRNSACGSVIGCDLLQAPVSGALLGTTAARAVPRGRQGQLCHLAPYVKKMCVRLTLDALDRVFRQAEATGLKV